MSCLPLLLLLVMIFGFCQTFAEFASFSQEHGMIGSMLESGSPDLSFSECLQLERIVVPPSSSSSSPRRAAKVLSITEGMPAYLHCPRQNSTGMEGKTNLKGAWTRMRDAALLAVGAQTFTLDLRFQVSKPRDQHSDWVLILRRTKLEDQGCYLCEVNTEPVSTLVPIYLKVNPIRRNVVGQSKRREEEGELANGGHPQEEDQKEDNGGHPQQLQQSRRNTRLEARIEGSTLVLNCSVERGKPTEEMDDAFWPSVIWTRNGKPLDLRNERKYSTDFRVSANRNALVFTLRVKEVSPIRDNGLYACQGDRLVKSAEIVNLPVNSSTFSKAQFFPLFSVISSLLFLPSPLLFPWRS